jgi:hypothetical protein
VPAYSPAGIAGTESALLADLPLRRIALFSSGVGYYEHSGRVTGTASSAFQITLPFTLSTINDALMSLTINDPLSTNPSVQYASADTLYQTLRSLSVDLSGNPGIADILNNLRGEEIEVYSPNQIRGRIIGVERKNQWVYTETGMASMNDESVLTLFTSQGLRTVLIKDIVSFSFTNERINADLSRALDLLMQSRNMEARNLQVILPGEGSRDVSISYVIPTPVWKVSYRLDFGGAQAGSSNNALLQGWAIIANDSDNDWNNVELSLVAGRPVSFIQNLYPPYRTSRPVLPLSIAGVAESRSYESGTQSMLTADSAMRDRVLMEAPMPSVARAPESSSTASGVASAGAGFNGGVIDTAQGGMAGDQFEFTLTRPISIARRQSAMLPLVESRITAEKVLVFPGASAGIGRTINPAISAELTNNSGMRLPAGPITVYDGGTYAGDALIEFFPENEKRLISYGDDLTVTGSVSYSSIRTVTAVTVSRGVMTITRRQDYLRTYSIRNASGIEKKLIIEHPITQGTTLGAPAMNYERTSSLYRFSLPLPAYGQLEFTVREETPVSERITLATLRSDTFLSYTTNQEIPANVRNALLQAIELRRIADEATTAQQDLENQRTRLVSEQDRIRRNLEAAGNQTTQGQEYLSRLVSLDRDIDAVNAQITSAAQRAQQTRRDYDDYLANLNL